MKSDLVELKLVIQHETNMAVKAYSLDDPETKVWLPKSRIEIEGAVVLNRESTVTLPEWLAIEKGLV